MSDLHISNIRKSFGTFQALKDFSLSIEAGEFICLLGASGCGKTTMLRTIAGLEIPDSGTIELGGHDLTKVPCHLRNIGMVFQSLALFPHLNVSENIAYGPRLRGAAKSEIAHDVERLLDLVGLNGLGARQISALSGGQRQRVAIARALALKPSVFLMDEPFSALDAGLREKMQVEVKSIQRDLGITTVFVTHDQREAMALADRIVIMNDGKIEQSGSPDTLYAQPKTRFVAEFLGTNNIFDADLSSGQIQIHGVQMGVAPHGAKQRQGTAVIAVRPEHIRIATPGKGLAGTLMSQRRLGAVIERSIDVNGQTVIQTSFVGQSPAIENGSTVTLSWAHQAAWVLDA